MSDSEPAPKRPKADGDKENGNSDDVDGRTAQDTISFSSKPASGIDVSQYHPDPNGTGWLISNADPSWTFNPETNVLFHTTTQQFYGIDPATGQLLPYSDTSNTVTAADKEEATATRPAVPDYFHAHSLKVAAGLSCMQGKRPTQEDRHTIFNSQTAQNVSTPHGITPLCFFGVYDGHLGSEASQYVADHLHKEFTEKLDSVDDINVDTAVSCLRQAFASVDKSFLRVAKIRKRMDGSCVACAVLLGNKLIVAHLGDSRVVLCRQGKAEALTTDHKPDHPKERQRIEQLGGHVFNVGPVPRVSPIAEEEFKAEMKKPAKLQKPIPLMLAVARSIGDYQLKIPKPLVSAEPDVTVVDTTTDMEFVIIGCDGVWDVLENQESVDLVRDRLKQSQPADSSNPMRPVSTEILKASAGAVVGKAYEKGSEDNISVMLIHFSHA